MEVLLALACLGMVYSLFHAYKKLLLPSQRIRSKLRSQGIRGPSPFCLLGNTLEMKHIQAKASKSAKKAPGIVSHDYSSSIFPYFEQWRKEHGLVYTYSTGLRHHLYLNDPELVKEINQSLTLDLGKPTYLTESLESVFGSGITRSNGLTWAHQRKIIAPEFFLDNVKTMVGLVAESTQTVLHKWEQCIESHGGVQAEILVDEDLRGLSSDVIARACFGSSYAKGKEIFSKLRNLQKLLFSSGFLFRLPSFRFYPDKRRRCIDKLRRDIETLIWDTVEQRERECRESGSAKKDLMQQILKEAVNGGIPPKRFIVDNCKTIYISGTESTAIAASWCLMLLALHPEWQSRIRKEVSGYCKDDLLDANAISSFKTVTMVIQEALRLYPPGAFVSREALAEVQIGKLSIPKGVCIWTFIPPLHKDPRIWGQDAQEFRPERFANGVSKACSYPQAYVPFGAGNRQCLGKHLAMMELKVVLALIVSRFSFTLSPRYIHSPTYRLLVEPEHGVRILIQKLTATPTP